MTRNRPDVIPGIAATMDRPKRRPSESPLARLFVSRARVSPDTVAVSERGRCCTYGELDAVSDRFAARLCEAGVGPGSLTAIGIQRGTSALAAMVAVLKAGGAYLPIDPLDTSERREFIVADSGAAWLAAEDPSAPDGLALRRLSNDPTDVVPAGTAYVIYTSGSTGVPKGVPVAGRSVLALFESAAEVYEFTASDVWSQFHALSFDFSVWEIWGALTNGATVAVVPPETARHPYQLADFLADQGVTVLSQVPTAFDALARSLRRSPHTFPDLRYVVFGGEAIRPESISVWIDAAAAPEARLVNMYGITETTVHVTYADLTARDRLRGRWGATFIGSPLKHLEMTAVDPETLTPVQDGVIGELLITGLSVTDGYLGRPEITGERLIRLSPDPLNRIWYRSGDLGFRDADGWWHCGRVDDQVKIGGVRIEPGEIEAVLRTCPLVQECLVVAPMLGSGRRGLVAAYVAAGHVADADPVALAGKLREHLSARLPAYLVPASFLRVARMPVSNGGKLDRRAVEELWLCGGQGGEGGMP